MTEMELIYNQRKNALMDRQPNTGYEHLDEAIEAMLSVGFDSGWDEAMKAIKLKFRTSGKQITKGEVTIGFGGNTKNDITFYITGET